MTDDTNTTQEPGPFSYLDCATADPRDAADLCLDLLCFLRCAERGMAPHYTEDEKRIASGRMWIMGLIEQSVEEMARRLKQNAEGTA